MEFDHQSVRRQQRAVAGLVDQITERFKTSFGEGVNNVVGPFQSLPGRISAAIGNLGSLLFGAGQNVIQGLINGIASMISRVGTAMANIAAKIRSYPPFSPAKVGPLSGPGNPEESGRTIVEMLSAGISQSALPASAMNGLLGPSRRRVSGCRPPRHQRRRRAPRWRSTRTSSAPRRRAAGGWRR